jgi:exopolyphosphatase/guanosine-5'-triphosphate,3'-diphosphate pyrophosphatase
MNVLATDGREEADIFPIRLAAADIGSNAIRFIAVEFTTENTSTVLDQIRVPVRLGHDVFLTGKLTQEAIDAATSALEQFGKRASELGVDSYRAVATSAVRESRNGSQLVEQVRSRTGVTIEPITGVEEARLVHLAVRSRVRLGKQKWLIADLGGGSVEVSVVDQDGVHRSESHEMGSVRLLEELGVAGEEPGRFRKRLEEYTATLRGSPILKANVAGFIATGGNIESLARLTGAAVDRNGVSVVPLNDLRAAIERLARLSYKDRIRELGLREDRADVILPGAMVYERIAVLAGVDAITVPNVGVKDGVVLDLLEQRAWSGRRQDTHERATLNAALALGRRFHFDEAHGRHVAGIAASLFEQLRSLHGLGRDDRKLLQTAALLHDVGTFIGLKRHHKHSLYIISQSELAGLTQNETLMVANIARYHRKNVPSSHHISFTELSDADRERVVKLSALLRLADALDREHLQRVESVSVELTEKSVELAVRGSGDLLLERWALQKKAQLFEKKFGRSIRLETALD